MKYLSLFSGIGGFELGIKQAYETIRDTNIQKVGGGQKTSTGELQKDGEGLHPISSEATLPTKDGDNEHLNWSVDKGQPTCIGYSEIDKYAIQVYNKNFNHKNYGDITKVNERELPDFELLVGGFPCQTFSIAGKRKGFNDTRGTLFFEIARIIREKQPRLLLLENVKGLLSHDKGNTFTTIISTLDELGYDLQWQVLNSKNFGVPQNRERVFIIGHLRGTPRPEVFPITRTGAKVIQTNRFQSTSNKREISRTLLARDYKDPKLVESKDNPIRRLTPKECERLQGFPDNWTELGRDKSKEKNLVNGSILSYTEISDTQRYKMCGNAVTVNVIQAIMEKLWKV